jgi:hypothetical protein
VTPRLGAALAAVGVAVAAWTALGIDARATYGARLTADEPQYLLTAISLAEDGSLDIADELAAERYRPFHEVRLPQQTTPLSDGRRLSPHDPLLPALLAPAVAVGGWTGAKLLLAATAGVLAALLVWTAVRRLRVPLAVAVVVVTAFAVGPPFVAYGTQVYPELPAALAVTVAAAALLGRPRAATLAVAAAAVVALPWLGVKYVPVAAVLAALALWRAPDRRHALGLAGGLVVAGVVYLGFHRLAYEGWTVYAAGDHFVGGELTVVGTSPNYPGRARRLYGLLVDRRFGLVPWAPGWLLVVPALAALVRARPRLAQAGPAAGRKAEPAAGPEARPQAGPAAGPEARPQADTEARPQAGPAAGREARREAGAAPAPVAPVLALPLAAGWLTATFVALTMHGWWWPGRQVVVVLPLAVLAVAWWAAQLRRRVAAGAVIATVAAAGLWAAVTWGRLLQEALARRLALVVDFDATTAPTYRALRPLFPDHLGADRPPTALDAAWVAALVLLVVAAARRPRPRHQEERPWPPADAPLLSSSPSLPC